MKLGWNLPLERLSATSLGMAIQCPEQFRQKYLLGRQEKMFGDRFLGIVDHRTHEWALHEKMNGPGLPDSEAVLGRYTQAWQETLDKEGEPDWKDSDPTEGFSRGSGAALKYHEGVSPSLNPVALEERFEFTLKGIPATIVGYLDIVERDKVRERKTTKVKVAKPKPKWRFQGRIYQVASGLPVQWDVVTRQVTPMLYTADEYEDLYLPYTNPDATIRLIRETALMISDLYSRLGADQPWPTKGIFSEFLCDYCVAGPRFEKSCIAWADDTASARQP